LIEKRFETQPVQAVHQPRNNFDYRRFVDFGIFSNAGASFSGAPAAANDGVVVNVEKQITPNTVLLHKTVFPVKSLEQGTETEVFSNVVDINDVEGLPQPRQSSLLEMFSKSVSAN